MIRNPNKFNYYYTPIKAEIIDMWKAETFDLTSYLISSLVDQQVNKYFM